jgi:hypothetical protein
MQHNPLFKAAIIGCVVVGLAACGGGGGEAPSPVPTPTPTPAAPAVSQAPASRAVAVGATVRFTVSAVGTGPFQYQWRRDGTPIPGATADTFTTAALALADDGARYDVVVGNSAGQVTSAGAVVTVFATPAPSSVCATPGAMFELVSSDAALATGKAAGMVLVGCTGPIGGMRWTQTAGPQTQPLLAARTQAITVEPQVAGAYRFQAQFTDGVGSSRTASVDLSVTGTAAPSTYIVARTDQAVREGQRASIRAWPTIAAGDAPAASRPVVWRQTEGPAVELDTSDPQRVIFTAPSVTRDTVLRFRATLRTATGVTDSDEVLVVVENLPPPPAGQLFDDPQASRVYAYRTASPYASALERCVYDPALFFNGGSTNLCTLGTLPLLAQETTGGVPSVAQIMNRVLVSHDWMGARFEAFLQAQPTDDLRRLLGSVNAVVIGAHVRPSFYWSATGAIYLDADNLWLTPAERDVVSEVPDFRSGFDRDLNYTGLWRYVVNNQPALLFFDPAARISRDLGYLDYELGSLLYHELAHANDFFPSAMRATARTDVPAYLASPSLLPSDRLAAQLPLQSLPMFDLAKVKFFGVAATDAQKAYTPRQVADFFRADRATDEYNYSIPPGTSAPSREDVAMLFEEFMMSLRHTARRDVGMTTKFRPGMTGSDLIVAWGQRGRVADPVVKPRTVQVLGELAPWISASTVDSLPAPVLLREGVSWTANLNPLATGSASAKRSSADDAADDARAIERLLRLREQRHALRPSLPR